MACDRCSRSLGQTAAIAADVARVLAPGDVLALDGPMGAGKTTFVRLLADALGVPPGMAASPTFVLAHVYPTAKGWRLVHIDAYRLRSAEDLEAAGWDRLIDEPGVVVVEWAGRVEEALPPGRVSWVRIAPEPATGTPAPLDRPTDGHEPGEFGTRRFRFEGDLGSRLAATQR